MPNIARFAVVSLLTVVVGGALVLMAIRGPAILIDLATSASAFICL